MCCGLSGWRANHVCDLAEVVPWRAQRAFRDVQLVGSDWCLVKAEQTHVAVRSARWVCPRMKPEPPSYCTHRRPRGRTSRRRSTCRSRLAGHVLSVVAPRCVSRISARAGGSRSGSLGNHRLNQLEFGTLRARIGGDRPCGRPLHRACEWRTCAQGGQVDALLVQHLHRRLKPDPGGPRADDLILVHPTVVEMHLRHGDPAGPILS